jgi:predicted permease
VNPLHVQAPQDVGVNPGVLFAALGLSLVTGLALSAAPAFFASRAAAAEGLEDATRRSAGSVRSRALRSLLVVTEVASASILLFGAGITVKTLGKLLHVSPGFEARRAVTFEISFPDLRYPDHTARRRAMAALQERLSAIPGVAVASGTTQLPLQELTLITSFDVEEHPAATSAERESAHFARVLPGYLRALGTTLLAGRDFTVADDETAPFIAIVSDGFAKKYFPKESPIGKRIVRYPKGKKTPMTIVGIASDVREISLAKDAEPAIYVPALQQSREFLRLLVRANADATGALVPSIRSAVWSVDKDLPIAKLAALRALVDESVARPRFSAQLLGVLAAIGLFLAAIGVYALLATHVAQKTREIGIRMALGATASEVARSVVAEGGRLAAAGVLVGAGASLVLGRLVASLLYGVKPTDPVAFLAATSALVGTALVASWLPARRASRLDPAAALRAE